jgi:DNA-binding NarL/FixJ family response regulator
VLDQAQGIELVASCGDLPTLREAIETTEPHVVVTDISMPPDNRDEGIRVANELRSSHPEIGVVVLSDQAERAYATLLFEEGFERRAYLLKESIKDPAELVRVLHTVAEAGSFVDPTVVEQLVNAPRGRKGSGLDELTPRELMILALIAEGLSNTAIADTLAVTKRAVERHINNIFLKLNLRDDQDVSRRVKAALLFLSGRVVRLR